MTSHHILTQAWQELATGPMLIEVKSGAALVHFADVAPAADTDAFHRLTVAGTSYISYAGTRTLFAKGGEVEAQIVVTETS